MNITRMLLVRNRYDPITFYMYEWSAPVKREAESKGITVDCVDGPKVTKSQIVSRIGKRDHDFIFLNGHGDDKTFYGYDDRAVIGLDNACVFKNRIVFTRSCNCLRCLGKESVSERGCTAFVGYQYEFVNVRQTDVEVKPRQDKVSKPIWEVSNAVPASLIKGSTVSNAVETSHQKASKEMARLIFSRELGAIQVLKAILANDEGLGYHGDGDARLSD